MAKTKTFEEILVDNPSIYENTEVRNDEATKAIIYDWFRYRRVTSNKKFPLYFQRVLNRDYTRYLQLLRIEAGKIGDTGRATNYDWLVTSYLESLEEGNENIGKESTGESARSLTPGTKKTTTHSGVDTTRDSSDTVVDSTDKFSTKDSFTDNSEGSSKANQGGTSTTRSGALSRTMPMSQSYDQSQMNYNDNRRGIVVEKQDGGFVVGTALSNESIPVGEEKGNIRALYRNFPEINITNPSSASDTQTTVGNTNAANTSEQTENTHDGSSDGNSESNTVTSNSGSGTFEHGHKIEEVFSGGDSSSVSDSGTEDIKRDYTNKHIHTGRDGETAKILTSVINFINKSSACDWFRKQLETCFMQCFDEEED